jgi:F0F1-type ATP synthase epsilon subunit
MVETVDLEEVVVMELLEQEVLQIRHHNQDREDLVVVMVVMVLFTWGVVEVDSAKQEILAKQVLTQDKVDLVRLIQKYRVQEFIHFYQVQFNQRLAELHGEMH